MWIRIYKENIINYLIFITIICFLLCFFTPWYTIIENKDFSESYNESIFYNYKINGIEINYIENYDNEKSENTVNSIVYENGVFRIYFMALIGLLLLIFFIYFLINNFKIYYPIKSGYKILLIFNIILLLFFILGYTGAYEIDYNNTDYKSDDLFIRGSGFIGYGEKEDIRGFGTDSSSECTTTMYWFPSFGFVFFIIILLINFYLFKKFKKRNFFLDIKYIEISYKSLKRNLKNSLFFKTRFLSVLLFIFLFLSLISPWFTIREQYKEDEYFPGIEGTTYTTYSTYSYYLNEKKYDNSENFGRSGTVPYSNPRFKEKDLGEKYFSETLLIILYILMISIIISIVLLFYIFFRNKRFKVIMKIQWILLILFILTIIFYSLFSNYSLWKDNDDYYESEDGYYPKADINQIPINFAYGSGVYENDEYGYSNHLIWYTDLGFYFIIICAIVCYKLIKNTEKLKNCFPK